jgi:uracil-DNA glycosylase
VLPLSILSDDSLKKIEEDTFQQRPGTLVTLGNGLTQASKMLISDRPKLDAATDDVIDQEMIKNLRSNVLGVTGIKEDDCYSCYAIRHCCSPAHRLWDYLRHVPRDGWKYTEEFEFGESPSERDYQPADLTGYRSLLLREVLVVRPTVIIVFGGLAAKLLLDTDDLVEDLRNRIHLLRINGSEFSVLVTFDLEYVLHLVERLPDLKQDFALLRVFLNHSSA